MHPAMARLILLDIHDVLAPQDQEYFRSSREARFGQTLEAVQAGRDHRREGVPQDDAAGPHGAGVAALAGG